MRLWEIEEELFARGYGRVCGVDEASRGPLAGPVFAAAVVLPPYIEIAGLNDSKKLSPKKREALFGQICETALDYCIASASAEEIDEINILQATYLAMNRAMTGLKIPPDMAIIDGNRSEGIQFPCITAVGGDGKSASVAAASILAKVSRDRLMDQLSLRYPQYHFQQHKGYGTRLHYEALRKYGPCEIHRRTFLKKMH